MPGGASADALVTPSATSRAHTAVVIVDLVTKVVDMAATADVLGKFTVNTDAGGNVAVVAG